MEKNKNSDVAKPSLTELYMRYPPGYPRLSERMALIPETGIYRRFDALNARNLLYLQSELCILERRLRALEKRDATNDVGRRMKYAADFETMLDEPPELDNRQLEVIKLIRKKVSQYNKALIQYETLHRLKSPDECDRENIRSFLCSAEMEGKYLEGEDCSTWGRMEEDAHALDLITVKPRKHVDWFSLQVAEKAVTLFKFRLRSRKEDFDVSAPLYYDRTVLRITFFLTSTVASLLPLVSIFTLDKLQSHTARFGVSAAFTLLVAVCLTLLTEARRADVFAVTAS
ncbi:hypothetical protein P280DRAFT_392393 [Massarina eburnea CBS 473.64]|uniref:DUF6594 domain-containing protein n=1 Tax=Massarina eburnea CBS 473.64 TaxID=1395130 RepID=A0A6A6S7Q0_9PLEO|nr:hypothetical protein P280DRAFT_392393 [Massarina eburnea CBS 473.64]